MYKMCKPKCQDGQNNLPCCCAATLPNHSTLPFASALFGIILSTIIQEANESSECATLAVE